MTELEFKFHVHHGKLSFSVLSYIMDHDLDTGFYLNWLASQHHLPSVLSDALALPVCQHSSQC